MFGRLGSFYLAQHLAEQDACRREERIPDRSPADQNLGIFMRLLGVMGIGFCAAGAIALMAA
ncbi:hypothetical protein ABK249_01705 [Neorhizobium sp. Rsf11]|uniref:Uncharacterized protein n=1 Tax=Neorhizobium phenanthreniclasticum TaxID=3157917 RepID=A0ABV0LVM4_9HYPH